MLSILGLENVSKKSLLSGNDADNDEYLDYLVWDAPSTVASVHDYDLPLPKVSVTPTSFSFLILQNDCFFGVGFENLESDAADRMKDTAVYYFNECRD